GYLKDALRYLHEAHTSDPNDSWVMLKLGVTYNILHLDNLAVQWFSLARASSDPSISVEAERSYRNLRVGLKSFRTTVWMYPFFSTRWHDVFGYGQIKTEFKLGDLPFRPYFSVRVSGDTRVTTGGVAPQYLSESSAIFAAGVTSRTWRGLTAWGEAGSAVSYLGRKTQAGRAIPDYRGGVSFGKGFGHGIGSETAGWFFETNADAVYVSRFEND